MADLYEKRLACDGKGQIWPKYEISKTCPDCEGVGFMVIGMTVGELEKLKITPWIPVVGDRVRSKNGATGTIERVFRGDLAGFQPNKVLVDILFDHGGHAYNFDWSDFEPV